MCTYWVKHYPVTLVRVCIGGVVCAEFIFSLCCRPALHEFVLAPYQDSWYRAQVTGIKDFYVTVLFIDYGNSEVLLYHQLMPMPRHFCSLPAMAVQGELYQLKDATNTVDQQMAGDQIKVCRPDPPVKDMAVAHTSSGRQRWR